MSRGRFRSKLDGFNARKRTEVAGRSFMSNGEAECFVFLQALESRGEIRDLECQVTVRLTAAKKRWILDFKFFDVALGEPVWADYKGGMESDRWKWLLDLWPHYGPGRLRVYEGRGMRMRIKKEILALPSAKEVTP